MKWITPRTGEYTGLERTDDKPIDTELKFPKPKNLIIALGMPRFSVFYLDATVHIAC